MKEVIITINGGDIADRIFSESAYAALARAKSGLPERFTDIVQATEDDRNLIERFIIESVNEVAGIISRYMSSCSITYMQTEENTGGTIYIRFTIPQNCPDSMATSLKESITSFAAARSLQHWMLTVKPDEANIHMSKAQNDIARIRELLSLRTRPVMGTAEDENIIEL
ncbi:MAG: hypothetical protein IKL56_06125 [Bacteroidaceae bacterium]|nr:hypothetical protein [Bacteroidaceae bacterium]